MSATRIVVAFISAGVALAVKLEASTLYESTVDVAEGNPWDHIRKQKAAKAEPPHPVEAAEAPVESSESTPASDVDGAGEKGTEDGPEKVVAKSNFKYPFPLRNKAISEEMTVEYIAPFVNVSSLVKGAAVCLHPMPTAKHLRRCVYRGGQGTIIAGWGFVGNYTTSPGDYIEMTGAGSSDDKRLRRYMSKKPITVRCPICSADGKVGSCVLKVQDNVPGARLNLLPCGMPLYLGMRAQLTMPSAMQFQQVPDSKAWGEINIYSKDTPIVKTVYSIKTGRISTMLDEIYEGRLPSVLEEGRTKVCGATFDTDGGACV